MTSRLALVTGGSSGIGLAVVRRFLAAGYEVSVADLRPAEGARYFQADVRDSARADEIVASLSRLDILVTCAGISKDAPLDKQTPEQWKDVLDVDLTGTWAYLHAAAPVMKRQGSGKIVTVASTVALRARRGLSNYVAAKAGVIGLTRAAARDLGRYGVNVNAVAPGLVDTPLASAIPPETRAKLAEETALGRIAVPEDVAGVVWFLCSDDARHVTGEVIRVDGGQLA